MRRRLLMIVGGVVLAGSLIGQAMAKPSAAMLAARQKVFGVENVNARNGKVRDDRVVFSWLTNATFAAAMKGHVVLLDSFVTRLEIMPGRTPIVIQDLLDLKPEAIFLGHGHFDHADNAAYIAQETGAVIYATPETCDNMAIDASNNFSNGYTLVKTVTCKPLTDRGSVPGAEIVAINDFEPDIRISVFKHLHSTNTGVSDPDAVPIAAAVAGVCVPTATKGNTFPCNLQDPRDPELFPAGTPLEPTVLNIATSRQGPGGPIALFYVFTVNSENKFKFVWHNSTGDIIDSCALPNNVAGTNPPVPAEPPQDIHGCFPGVTVKGQTVGANLASIMESLAPVDVEIGSVVSLGYNQNGERDVVSYIQHVKPRYFIPNHLTAVAAEGSSLEWKVGFYDALHAANVSQAAWPIVWWLVDPNDYLRPLVFDLNQSADR
jgi:hypothetical protein